MRLTADQMTKFARLSTDIGNWAQRNFGQNAGKPDWLTKPMHIGHEIVLGPYAPLIGMGEEIGELTTAIFEQDLPEIQDGFADVLIYSIDFTRRWGLAYELIMQEVSTKLSQEIVSSPKINMQAFYGRLCHVSLKTAQGIRGFEVAGFALTELGKALVDLLWSVIVIALPVQSKEASIDNVIAQLYETWDKIVSKRDWVKKPEGN